MYYIILSVVCICLVFLAILFYHLFFKERYTYICCDRSKSNGTYVTYLDKETSQYVSEKITTEKLTPTHCYDYIKIKNAKNRRDKLSKFFQGIS